MTTSQSVIAALDVGGSSIKYGIVDLDRCSTVMSGSQPVNAEASAPVILDDLGTAANAVLSASVLASNGDDTDNKDKDKDNDNDNKDNDSYTDSACLAVAFPGPFDYRSGQSLIRGQRKYDAIFGHTLAPVFRDRCNRPDLDVRFCNDADAAAWGEAHCGAGQDLQRFLMITLGTGFGGSLVDRTTSTGPGLDENIAARLYERQVADHGRADDALSAYGLACLVGVEPGGLHAASAKARQGSGGKAFELFGHRLGRFLVEVSAELEVDAVVVGGGAAATIDLFEPSLREHFSGRLARAALGQEAGLFGAAALFS